MNVSGLDFVIVSIVLISSIFGFYRGFAKESLSLVVWVIALFLATNFSYKIADFLENYVPIPSLIVPISYLIIVVSVLIVGRLLSSVISSKFNQSFTNTDSILGILFGLFRAIVILSIIAILLEPFVLDQLWWESSFIVPNLLEFKGFFVDKLPFQKF